MAQRYHHTIAQNWICFLWMGIISLRYRRRPTFLMNLVAKQLRKQKKDRIFVKLPHQSHVSHHLPTNPNLSAANPKMASVPKHSSTAPPTRAPGSVSWFQVRTFLKPESSSLSHPRWISITQSLSNSNVLRGLAGLLYLTDNAPL